MGAKISMSNLSASSLEIGTSPRTSGETLIGSGRKGISMLETTSKSRRPSIWIWCILARPTNLSSRKGKYNCVSQNEIEIQNGTHQKVFLLLESFTSPSTEAQRGSIDFGPGFPSSALRSGSTLWKLKMGLWWRGCFASDTISRPKP